MSTICWTLTKWGVVWYIPKSIGWIGMQAVIDDWVISPSFPGGISEHFILPLHPHKVCPFPCSKVGWIKREVFLSHHDDGKCTCPWQQPIKGKIQVCFIRLFPESAHKFSMQCLSCVFPGVQLGPGYWMSILPFPSTWAYTQNHLRQSEMSIYWSWWGRYHAWKSKYWQSDVQHISEK